MNDSPNTSPPVSPYSQSPEAVTNSSPQSTLPQKSTLWMVGTIWANVIIMALIVFVVGGVLGAVSGVARTLPLSTWSAIVYGLQFVGALVGVYLGVRTVQRRSVITQPQVVRVAIGTGAIPPLVWGILVIVFFFAMPSGAPADGSLLLRGAIAVVYGIVLGGLAYYLLSRAAARE